MRPDWQAYAMSLAEVVANRSEDQHLRVGCVILREDRTVASAGYNGAPPGVDIEWGDRDERRPYVIHAEVNALRYVKPGEGWLLASTAMPCQVCILQVAAYGIKEVVYRDELDPQIYDRDQILAIAAMCGIAVRRETL